MRILGLDVGDRRIGVAVSDETLTFVTPIEVIKREDDTRTIFRLKEIISNYDISEIVVGLPKGMDGEDTCQTRKVYSFIVFLKREIKLPIRLWDERLSTVMAEKILINVNMGRKNQKGVIDKLSAGIILQNYLDYKKEVLKNEKEDMV